MNINEVNTAILVGEIKLKSGNAKKLWEVDWCKEHETTIKDTAGRVYLIVSNGEIKKIGGSQDKKGLKGTFDWYQNKALVGKPSVRTYGIHMLIYQEIMNGNDVKIYLITSQKVYANVKGLFGETNKLVSVDFKEVEGACKQDYQNIHNRYPDWNFQENGEQWPVNLSEECNSINQLTTKKRKDKDSLNK